MALDPAAERLPDKALAEEPEQVIGFNVPKRSSLEGAEGQDKLAGIVLKAVSLFQSNALVPEARVRRGDFADILDDPRRTP